LYLVAIIDWFSRYVVSWSLDDTLEIGFVLALPQQPCFQRSSCRREYTRSQEV
jgi:putative transposase